MIRFVLRLAGFALVAAGFVALVVDGTRSIAGGRLLFTMVEDSWQAVHAPSLQAARRAVEASLPGWVWDPVIATALLAPTALAGLGLGALLMTLGRKREPQIGVVGRR